MPDEQPNIGEAVETVAGILTGKPQESSEAAAPTEPEPDAPAEAGEEAGAPELTPKAIAETLGISPNKLFTEMLIPVDGGDPLTLEEFKAKGQELRGLQAAQHELAEGKAKFENSVMLQRQQLEQVLAKIPADMLTEEMVSEVQAEHQSTIKRERTALLTIKPELKDPAKWNATRDLLVDHLRPYGFKEIEVDSIIDHRLAKYVIDNAEREKRIRELDAESLQPEKPSKVSKPTRQPAAKRAKKEPEAKRKGDERSDKVAKIAELIGATQDG